MTEAYFSPNTRFLNRNKTQMAYFHRYAVNTSIFANRPYIGGTVPIFFAHTVPIFLDCVPIFLNSLNVQTVLLCPQIW